MKYKYSLWYRVSYDHYGWSGRMFVSIRAAIRYARVNKIFWYRIYTGCAAIDCVYKKGYW